MSISDSQHALAKQIAPGPQVTPSSPKLDITYGRGVIFSASNTSAKVALYLNGAPNTVNADRLESGPSLKPGQVVECLIVGKRIIVLGPFGGPVAGSKIQVTRSYPVLGPLVAYTFPGFSTSVPSSQTVDLVAVETHLTAGTGTVDITHNGIRVPGLTTLAVTTTSSGYLHPTTSPTPMADKDRLSFILASPAGTGDIVIDYAFEITLL